MHHRGASDLLSNVRLTCNVVLIFRIFTKGLVHGALHSTHGSLSTVTLSDVGFPFFMIMETSGSSETALNECAGCSDHPQH